MANFYVQLCYPFVPQRSPNVPLVIVALVIDCDIGHFIAAKCYPP